VRTAITAATAARSPATANTNLRMSAFVTVAGARVKPALARGGAFAEPVM
jgi:hypothetical protein